MGYIYDKTPVLWMWLVNDKKFKKELGFETSKYNPCYSRAYKAEFEQIKETKVLDIELNESKQGYFKPVCLIEPTDLDGVVVKRATGNNMRYIVKSNIVPGSIIKVKRSGMVIPKIVGVVSSPVNFVWKLPEVCPSCGKLLSWNKTNVELMCTNEQCSERIFKKLLAFFKLLKIKGLQETTIRLLTENGFDSILKIIGMQKSDFLKLEKFGNRKSDMTFTNIQEGIKNIELSRLQHASGYFTPLGYKKLKLLSHFTSKPTINDVIKIKGFSNKTAENFVKNYDNFFSFLKTLPIIPKQQDDNIKITGNKFNDTVICFTGFRDDVVKNLIEQSGGKVVDSVGKDTTHLVIKKRGSGSSKETKATEKGIPILEIDEFKKLYKI